MSRLTHRLTILSVLAAFLAAQGSLWIHHAGHTAEKAAHTDEHACPHETSDLHFCNIPAEPDQEPDCALCTSVTGRHIDSITISIHNVATAHHAAAPLPDSLPWTTPEAAPPAPRGPPA
jgi:hypothetical protein